MKVKGNGNVKIKVKNKFKNKFKNRVKTKLKTKVKINEFQLKVGKRLAFEIDCAGVGVAFDFAVVVVARHPLLRRQ